MPAANNRLQLAHRQTAVPAAWLYVTLYDASVWRSQTFPSGEGGLEAKQRFATSRMRRAHRGYLCTNSRVCGWCGSYYFKSYKQEERSPHSRRDHIPRGLSSSVTSGQARLCHLPRWGRFRAPDLTANRATEISMPLEQNVPHLPKFLSPLPVFFSERVRV